MSRRARMVRHHRDESEQKKAAPTVVTAPNPAPRDEVEVEVSLEVEVEVELEAAPEPAIAEVLAEVQADGVVTEEEEDQLRQLAKSKGIPHWWSKSVERIQAELAELEA